MMRDASAWCVSEYANRAVGISAIRPVLVACVTNSDPVADIDNNKFRWDAGGPAGLPL